MNKRHQLGKNGEIKAAVYYEKNGFKILSRNYRSGRGEIDLILKKDNLIVFCEVKTRSNDYMGFPEKFLSERQKQLIKTTASAYIYSINWQGRIRFDIIALHDQGPLFELRHFKDAFY